MHRRSLPNRSHHNAHAACLVTPPTAVPNPPRPGVGTDAWAYQFLTEMQRSTYITSKNLLGSDCIPFHHLFRVLPHVFRILREAQFEELQELPCDRIIFLIIIILMV